MQDIETPVGEDGFIELQIRTMTGKTFPIKARSSDTAHDLREYIESAEGVPPDQAKLLWGRKRVPDDRQIGDIGIKDGDTVILILCLTGGKPVIYLFPPSPLASASVNLTLVPAWSFTALYPVVKPSVSALGASTVVWNVSAAPDGALVDLSSGEELAYLFWEARTNFPALSALSALPPSPPRGPGRAFDPLRPSLTPDNAVLLSLANFLPYLSNTLKNLTLHPNARNDFITYWLPAFVRLEARGCLIALRFVRQDEYAQAARLEVHPKPDVTTRIFMLFGGVQKSRSEEWQVAAAAFATVDWGATIGLRTEASDPKLFRVLEWGGMEVMGI